MKNMIEKYCKELRLGNVLVENYQKIETTNNEEFLLKLLKISVDERKNNRKNRLLKQANFDMIKTFENYITDEIKFSFLSINNISFNLSILVVLGNLISSVI